VEAARLAVDVLGHERMIVTTGHDRAVRAVRDWGDAEGLELRVGLSLGRSVRRLSWLRRIEVIRSELFPHVRIRESRANLVVAHHVLARLGVAAYARRRGIPLLVWTVDAHRSLRYWLRPGRAWLVTTNHPGLAMEVRAHES
jgi:glycerophosphoryl diester phosphodiesterase